MNNKTITISRLPRETDPSGVDIYGVKTGRDVKISLDTLARKEDVSSSLLYLPSVRTKALLYTTYPNPINGEASLVESEGYIYQYRSDIKDWVKTPFKAFPDDVATREELEDKADKTDVDFYSDLFTIKGKYVRKVGEPDAIDASMMCTPLLPILQGREIVLDCKYSNMGAGVVFYDENKNRINYLDLEVGVYNNLIIRVDQMPSNAKFIRASSSISTDKKTYRIYKGIDTLSVNERVNSIENNINDLEVNLNNTIGNLEENVNENLEGLEKNFEKYIEKTDVQKELNTSDNPIASKAIPLSNVDSSDSVYSLVDTDNKVLMSFSKDAIPYIANLDKVAISKDTFDVGIVESEEFIYTITDKDDRVLWGIKKDGSFYPKTGNDSELIASSGLLINNLKNQNKTEVELITGTYGGNASVYKTDIKSETSRIVFDFFINENVNTGNEDKTFASIKHSDGSTTDLKIAKRATSLLFGTPNATTHKILQQQPQYNSGFYVGSSFIQRAMKYTEPLIGEDVISIWYKPLFQDVDTVTQQMVRDRANEIEPMRDLAIVMENDSFSIVRDGLDVTDNLPSFNNGTTSVIFSTPLKDGSVWKTLSAFYEELKNAPELVDFDINFYDLSYRKNCGDLLQFGKIKLVGLYTQRFVYGGENERLYDSFPAVLKFAVDNKKHTCEIVYVNNTLYVSIDGDMISKNTSKIESILIGGNEKTNGLITPFDLVVNDGNIGDAEIVSSTTEKRIISERTPYMVGFMGHYLMDNYEPQAQGTQNLGQSLSRMEDVCIELQKRSYVNISIDEMVDYVSGNKKMPKRCAFFVFDDNRVENIYETIRHRQTMSKYGMKGIIGTPSKYYHDNNKDDKMFKMFTSMRGNGWNCMSHTYYHNVPYPLKPSIILHNELKKIIEVADVLNMSNNTLVYSFFGEWENVYALLRLNGYVLTIVNNTPKNYVKSTSRYNIGRCNMADDTNWSAVNSVLI